MPHTTSSPTASRIDSIDILRGFAVLGILLVNCAYFALPINEASELAPVGERSVLELLSWGFVNGFAALKFVTIFSFLFGIGFAMQLGRATKGSGFHARYSRRLVLLALFGLLHGVFLFMGDILLCYAFCGTALLVCSKLSAKGMLAAGLVLVMAMVPWVSVLTFFDAVDSVEPSPAFELAEGVISPGAAFEAALGPNPARLSAVELRVFAEGPFASSTALRAGEFILFLMLCLFYFGWRALGFFFLGAAVYRLGLFTDAGRPWRVRMRNIGLGIGLPLTLVVVVLGVRGADHGSPALHGAVAGLGEVASFFLPAGYAGLVLLWSETARGALARALAAVGRMALTNYIGQSVVMSFIVCHWGLGLYGELDLPQLLGLSALVFATQLVLSPIWLTRFRMGPLEWVWRWATYGSRPAFLR